ACSVASGCNSTASHTPCACTTSRIPWFDRRGGAELQNRNENKRNGTTHQNLDHSSLMIPEHANTESSHSRPSPLEGFPNVRHRDSRVSQLRFVSRRCAVCQGKWHRDGVPKHHPG